MAAGARKRGAVTVRSVGLVALHSCPLSALGEGKAGGMSAYVLGLGRELARRGIRVTIVTASHQDAHSMDVDCGMRVAHLPSSGAGSAAEWVAQAGTFAEEIRAAVGEGCDLIHTHYWASGLAGLEVSRLFDVPHVTTFHTIAAVKEQAVNGASLPAGEPNIDVGLSPESAVEPQERHTAERAIAQGADGIVAWTGFEAEITGFDAGG